MLKLTRGLFKCFKLNKAFNADVVGALNILKRAITPSPSRIGVTGRKPSLGLNSSVALNLPTLMAPRTLTL